MLAGAKRKQKNQKVWLCGRAPEIQEVEEWGKTTREFSKVHIQDCDQNCGDYPLSNRANYTCSCLF
ncbi:hypothetical protein Hanom_Chr03g00228381 [Helianthus anomalus]